LIISSQKDTPTFNFLSNTPLSQEKAENTTLTRKKSTDKLVTFRLKLTIVLCPLSAKWFAQHRRFYEELGKKD
jgi:hypothetical protein